MAINLEKDKTYPLSKNYNNTERRETETQPQAPSKKTMDNSAATMYNKLKENNTIKQPTVLRDFASQWKQKNQGALKYAGDLAKKSINAGLEEAKTFMRDADEGTSFEKVQDASVKWKLAQDSNNPKLLKNAQNEMIGHLSRENKDTYLKDAQPLQTYVDAKDEFDYKNNNYTTTESLDTTPDENVRNLQRELNEKGYTDKFGEKLKEDGIYGGKTAYANDKRKYDESEDIPVVADPRYEDPTYGEKFVSVLGPVGNGISSGYTSPKTSVKSNTAYSTKSASKTTDTDENPLTFWSKSNKTKKSSFVKIAELISYGTGNEKANNIYHTYNYVVKKANELDLPVDLCLATVFRESSFRHYKYDLNGNIVVNENNGDYGLMQININAHPQAFRDKETYGDIINNWHDNINYGLSFLKECYEEAKKWYSGDELLKATYSNYNSGKCSAYKNPAHEAHANVKGFWSIYTNKEWLDILNMK